MGYAAQARIREHYSVDVMARKHVHLYTLLSKIIP